MEYLRRMFVADKATVLMITVLMLVLVVCVAMVWSNILVANITGGARGKNSRRAKETVIKDLTKTPRTKSEAYVVKTLEEITGLKFPTAFPSWLRGVNGTAYELDGYNEEAKIAIEFSGPMHTKWIQNKESYAEYLKRVKRDEFKIKTCASNGVALIIIDSALPVIHIRGYLKSRLYDVGWFKEKPFDYIMEQKIEPYRNLELEK